MKPDKNPHAIALGRLGGSVRSAAKSAAARRNGAKHTGKKRLAATKKGQTK